MGASGQSMVGSLVGGLVGGVVGGLVVALFSSQSYEGPTATTPDPPPTVEPAHEISAEPAEAAVEDPPVKVPFEVPTEVEAAPAPKPTPLDPSPATEAAPYALRFAVPDDASDFVREQLRDACAGDVDAMLRVADWMGDGAGVPQSVPGANTWLRRARACCSAEPGDAGTRRVVRAHAKFLAYPPGAGWANQEAAFKLLDDWVRSDPEGHDAALDLAELHAHGHGTPADPAKAHALTRKVAERLFSRGKEGYDEARAYASLARQLRDGVGCDADLREAALWCRRSVEGGVSYSINDDDLLAAVDLYAKLDEVPGGVLWLRHYTEKSGSSAFFLGRCFEEGLHGIERDAKQALAYYQQAFKLEHAHAEEAVTRLGGSTVEVEEPGK